MTRLIVITGFIVAFTAGLMAGFAWKGNLISRAAPGDSPRPGFGGGPGRDPGSWIAQQLDLTPEQQKQMKEIWSEVSHRGGGPARERRGQIRHEQEEAIAKLIHEQDKTAYQKIIDDAKVKADAIEADGRKSFEQAVAKTKSILSADQLKKYEAILAKAPGPPDRGPGGERGDRAPPPSTRP